MSGLIGPDARDEVDDTMGDLGLCPVFQEEACETNDPCSSDVDMVHGRINAQDKPAPGEYLADKRHKADGYQNMGHVQPTSIGVAEADAAMGVAAEAQKNGVRVGAMASR